MHVYRYRIVSVVQAKLLNSPPSSDAAAASLPVSHSTSNLSSRGSWSEFPRRASFAAVEKFQYNVSRVCSVCWTQRKVSERKSRTSSQCRLGSHVWNDYSATFLIVPGNKVLRPLPAKCPRDLNFIICWDVENNGNCYRTVCSFAHSNEEIEVWKWMARNKGN